jgi:hypothetical protein
LLQGSKCKEYTTLSSKQLTYTLDDRETNLILTSGLGWDHCVVSVHPPYREGTIAGFIVDIALSWDELEALRQYLVGPVRLAMRRDEVTERSQVQVPFKIGKAGALLCMSPNDIENVSQHIREIASYARSVALAGSMA